MISSKEYGRAVDWWGLGVVMYELLTGKMSPVTHILLNTSILMTYLFQVTCPFMRMRGR